MLPPIEELVQSWDVMEPDQDEFDQALADAEGLFQFVLSVLPVAVHPAP